MCINVFTGQGQAPLTVALTQEHIRQRIDIPRIEHVVCQHLSFGMVEARIREVKLEPGSHARRSAELLQEFVLGTVLDK